jgi:hypothetical protein
MRSRSIRTFAMLVVLAAASPARADEDPAKVEQARQLFAEGTERVKAAEWSKALSSFERSAALKPHAITTYNIGACHRAIGRYTLARVTFAEALRRHGSTNELPDGLKLAAEGFVDEIDRLVSHVRVKIAPADARISIDGAPLGKDPSAAERMLAGIRPPGPGEAAPSGSFDLVVDPGAHVIVLSRKGFRDVVLNKTFAPSSKTALDLELDKLPGVMHIASTQPGAVVAISGIDVGVTPVDVTRPAGSYRVLVRKEGYVAYSSQVTLKPGEDVALRAQLVPESKSVFERWWFWAGATALVAGAVVTTYVVTRPDPTEPPLNGGGLGWSVPVQ